MIVRYTLPICGRCPVNGDADHYEATIEASIPIMVEDILAAVKSATADPVTQESLARLLRKRLPGSITLVGYHSGVRVEVIEP